LNIQGNGAGLTGSDSKGVAKAGQWIVIAGLGIQVATVGFFVLVAVMWHRRMGRRVWAEERMELELVSGDQAAEGGGRVDREPMPSELPPWRTGLWMLYVCSALIAVRSVFRLVEYVQGPEGYLLSREWPTYSFDASLMLLLQIVYVIWFPKDFKVEMSDRRKKWMRLLK
jgi:hypothetical protein